MAEQRKREDLLEYYKKLVADEKEELSNKHLRFTTETSSSTSSTSHSNNEEGICKFFYNIHYKIIDINFLFKLIVEKYPNKRVKSVTEISDSTNNLNKFEGIYKFL